MTEHGDSLSRRYRELAREEPPAALDAAIVAAARRATNARPRRNWGATVSIAAVLVLGFGISLRMQTEQPGIETSAPTSEQFAAPTAAPAKPAMQAPAAQAPAMEAPTTQAPAGDSARVLKERVPAPPPKPTPAPASALPSAPEPAARADPAYAPAEKSRSKLEVEARPSADSMEHAAPAPPAIETLGRTAPEAVLSKDAAAPAANLAPPAQAVAPTPPSPRAAPVPAPAASPAAPVTAPAAAPAPYASPMASPRVQASPLRDLAVEEKKSSRATTGIRGFSANKEPAVELEEIARLRQDGRHADADKALEEFRRRHPDFRIPEAMWERVRPR